MNCVTNRKWLALAISAALTACGGGGGGDTAPGTPGSNTLTVPLSTAFANYVNQTKSTPVAVTGTITSMSAGQTINLTGSGTFSESTSSGIFEGKTALQKNGTVTGTLSGNGVTVPISASTQSYFDTNYQPLGSTSSTSYCVVTSSSPLPATARVGDNGPFFTGTCYTSSSKLTQTNTETTSYVVEPDTASTALFKLISILKDGNGNTLPVTSTFRVANNGAIAQIEETTSIVEGGDSLNLTVTYLNPVLGQAHQSMFVQAFSVAAPPVEALDLRLVRRLAVRAD